MGTTIGSSPRPVTVASTSSAATAAPAAAPAPQAPVARDTFAASATPSRTPLGEPKRTDKTPDQIKNLSNDELKAISGEEVMGMTRIQFDAYETAIARDGGPGMANLDPQARKAILRKNLFKGLMEECARQAEKHNKW